MSRRPSLVFPVCFPVRFPVRTIRVISLVSAISVVGVVGAVWVSCGVNSIDSQTGPAIVATQPRDVERLSPQLRNYLVSKTAWVDERGGDAKRHRILGLIYEANQLWQEACDSFAAALTLEPDHPLTQYHAARCLIGLGRMDEAEAALAAIAAQHPDLAPALCRWGELLLDRGRFDEAGRAFALVVQHRPNAPHGYLGRGAALVLSGSYSEAVEFLDQALARAPQHARTHYLLGLAYRGLGQKRQALAALKLGASSSVAELPDRWQAELARHSKQISDQIRFAKRVQQSGDSEQARAILEEALRWNPGEVRFLKALALSFQVSGECDTALSYLARARKAEPLYPGTAINVASCLVELDRLDEAETAAREAVALAPTLSASHMILAFILNKLGRNAEALAATEEARQLEPTEARIALKQAQLSLLLDRRNDARRYFEEVTELEPSNLQGHLSLAKLHATDGQWKLARQSMREARALAPRDERVAALARSIAQKSREESR